MVFHNTTADRRFFDHGSKFKNIHIGHATIMVAVVQIFSKQGILIFGGPGRNRAALKLGIAFDHAFLASRQGETRHIYARRQTGRTFSATRAVQDILGPAKTLF